MLKIKIRLFVLKLKQMYQASITLEDVVRVRKGVNHRIPFEVWGRDGAIAPANLYVLRGDNAALRTRYGVFWF